MQFQSVFQTAPPNVASAAGATAVPAGGVGAGTTAAPPPSGTAGAEGGGGGDGPPPRNPTSDVVKNLLTHVPGEASGFYLMALGLFTKTTNDGLLVLFLMALTILVLVRWLAGASRDVLITSILAFVIWMACFDQGYIMAAFPAYCPKPWGTILALFYSAVVTILASAGKLK